MEQLPKIVRERLQAGGAVGEHPDPNVLSAFVERSLVGGERVRVLEHLTRCPDCREVLAVATAVLDAEGAPEARAGSSWFRWPALRWGAVAACCVIVGAAVLVRQDMKHTAPAVGLQKEGLARDQRSVPVEAELTKQEEERSAPAKRQEEASAAKTSAPQPPSAPSPTAQPQVVEEQKLMAKEADATPGLNLKKTAPASGVAGGVATRVPPPPLPVPRNPGPTSAGVTAHSDMADQTATVQSETVQVEAGSNSVATAQSPTAGTTLVRRELGKAKASPMPPPAPNLRTTENTLQPAEVNSPPSASLAIPRWQISAEGQLRRSFDSGKTWEAVSVIDSSTAALSSTVGTTTASDGYGPAMLSENKKDRQEPTAPGSQPKLHALCANGNDVWVGGAAGALYHSPDAGLHWTRVRPTAGGVTLTADIVALDFTDPQHGKLTSSAGESWVTGDGGRSWQKQSP